jgi:hypothetical protein
MNNSLLAVVGTWVGLRPPIIEKVLDNHRQYGKAHGYEYLHFDPSMLANLTANVGNDADAHWIKPQVIARALKDHEYRFWTDLDAGFHNVTVSLEDLLRRKKGFRSRRTTTIFVTVVKVRRETRATGFGKFPSKFLERNQNWVT